MSIRYSCAPSALGMLLAAASGRGIVHLAMGDDEDVLVRACHARYPDAVKVTGAADLTQALDVLCRYIEQPTSFAGNLPVLGTLDIQGTAFQKQVWAALREIPRGETRSYAQIARRIGQPSAYRAVAGACAANPLALVIPCHRVIRADGGLSGFGWGVQRKQALLQREGARIPALSQ